MHERKTDNTQRMNGSVSANQLTSCQTAHHSLTNVQSVTIVHPAHPLFGLTCAVITIWQREGETRFHVRHPETGEQHSVQVDFTDAVATHFHDAGDSLPLLDITTLRALIAQVGRLKQAQERAGG